MLLLQQDTTELQTFWFLATTNKLLAISMWITQNLLHFWSMNGAAIQQLLGLPHKIDSSGMTYLHCNTNWQHFVINGWLLLLLLLLLLIFMFCVNRASVPRMSNSLRPNEIKENVFVMTPCFLSTCHKFVAVLLAWVTI